ATLDELPDPETILTLILAPLVFAAGLSSSAVDLRKVGRRVFLLAVGLVTITTLLVGAVVSVSFAALTFAAACALGAVLAPTDAVAAAVVAARSGLPRRVTLVIEGESLANDGTALTILRVAVLAVVAGSVTLLQSTGILLTAVLGGIAVGVIGGFVVAWLMRASRQAIVANAILLLTPFALYETSERIGGSGILTVVIAGVWISHSNATKGNPRTRLQGDSIWSLITFLLESLAFVLVGAEFLDTYARLDSPHPLRLALIAVGLTALLMVIRFAFMAIWFVIGPKVRPELFKNRKGAAKEFIAIGLLGVRGPISVLAAFSIPLTIDGGAPFPGRDIILILTFGVVTISLLMSHFAEPIIRRLNLSTHRDQATEDRARLATAKASLRRLDEIAVEADSEGRTIDSAAFNDLRAIAIARVETLKAGTQDDEHFEVWMARRDIRQSMLNAEREELDRLISERLAPGEVLSELTRELDIRQQVLGDPDTR
ncbi:MAG: cation:proton antiporter, partial [Actinobacteria bacterium]|nr:cation:proton antiporter [Actinomycetota bacterium]